MRVVVVVAAMLFCATVFAQGVKLKSVTNSIGMELIEIPAGKFTMGSPEGEKDHDEEREAQVSVTLTKSFGLGKTEVTHGEYTLDFLLRNAANDTVWSWSPQAPLQHEDPLMPQQLAFHDLVLEVPSPGRYELAMLVGGEEIGLQPIWIGLT